MSGEPNLRTKRSISNCPQPRCGGGSQVMDTTRHDTWYIRRVRSCTKCGHTWSTAEVPLPMIKRTLKLDAFLQKMGVAK
jgi:transcriptional regulator NrdR family protein